MFESAWFDKKVEAHLSTIVGPGVTDIVRGNGERVSKPKVVSSYTWFMGGVDQDQKRSYYECKIGTALEVADTPVPLDHRRGDGELAHLVRRGVPKRAKNDGERVAHARLLRVVAFGKHAPE